MIEEPRKETIVTFYQGDEAENETNGVINHAYNTN